MKPTREHDTPIEQIGSKFVSTKQLRAGDVILCYKKEKFDFANNKIRERTNSAYSHAAICIDCESAV